MAHYTMTVAPYYMAMGYAQAACQFMVSQSGSGNVININSGANPLSGTPQPNQAASVGNAQNGGRVLGEDFFSLYFFPICPPHMIENWQAIGVLDSLGGFLC